MKFKKVALVSLPKQDLIRPPAALPILAATCEEKNIDYTINDFNLWLYQNVNTPIWNQIDDNWAVVDSYEKEQEFWFDTFRNKLTEFVKNMLTQQCDLIAISVFTDWSAHCAIEMIETIRRYNNNVTIVIGGTGIEAKVPRLNNTTMCSWLLEKELINFYIHGEGEHAFRLLLDGNVNGPGINNTNSVQITDLNQYPTPSYKKIDPKQYAFYNVPSLTINGSRGCVRHCSYCDVAKYWPKFTFKSGIKLANEIYETWKSTGITDYEFSDSLINGSVKEFRLLNQTLIQLKQQDSAFNITYKGQFICRGPKQFTETDYRDMKDAGCSYIYVGVETFSEKVRFDMRKKFTNGDFEFHLAQCGKYGIPNVILMIVGYPTETALDHQDNINGLKKYKIYMQAGIIKMITFGFTTSILKDTPLYLEQEHLGIVPEFENFDVNANWISLKNSTLTFKERVRRWVELTELANQLGYKQPRIESIVNRLEQLLKISNQKDKNKMIKIHLEK